MIVPFNVIKIFLTRKVLPTIASLGQVEGLGGGKLQMWPHHQGLTQAGHWQARGSDPRCHRTETRTNTVRLGGGDNQRDPAQGMVCLESERETQ